MKAVHWTVPFASLKGVQYRVDIYADGECATPIELMGGATPFVTDEDNSDDYFAPVRSQTGNLTVIDEDGTLMETLMPADNIDRPVRLMRKNADNTETVMWQGFLSCEAYSQDYTARAQELTLNVNSVLAAMESVQMKTAHDGLRSIYQVITDCFVLIDDAVLFPVVYDIYIPKSVAAFFKKKIDDTAFFKTIENQYENKHITSVEGISAADVLTKICQFSNTVIREAGKNIYIQANSEYRKLVKHHKYNWINGNFNAGEEVNGNDVYMVEFEYRGTGHKTDIRCGCAAVEVTSKIDDYDNEMSLPEFTVIRFEEYYTHILEGLAVDWWDYTLFCYPKETHNNVDFKYYKAKIKRNANNANVHSTMDYSGMATSDRSNYISKSIAVLGRNAAAYDGYINPDNNNYYYAGAMFARNAMEEEETVAHQANDGIYCTLFPATYGAWGQHHNPNEHIFSILSVKNVHYPKGSYVCMESEFDCIGDNLYNNYNNGNNKDNYERLMFALRIGDKWYNGSGWQTTRTHFLVPIVKGKIAKNWASTMRIAETDGLLIDVTEDLFGEMELRFYPYTEIPVSTVYRASMCEVLFKELSVDIKLPAEFNLNVESENKYHLSTGSHFEGTQSIGLELSSSLNNRMSPSIIMNDDGTQMQTLEYVKADGTTESVRPEERLAERMKEYYSDKRYRRTLEIENEYVLPNTEVIGYDEKTYLPLSESRDWRTDTSKVTCFETGNSEQLTENNE